MTQRWRNDSEKRKVRVDRTLIEMICLDMQPISVVEDTGFRNLMKEVAPDYSLPSRRDIRSKLLPNLYDEISTSIKEDLNRLSCIGLTTEHWTSRAKDAYMVVTAHGLTDNFEAHDVCLDIKYVPESHTAQNIAEELQASVEKWLPELKSKPIYITADNASNMVAALNSLPSNYTPLGCFVRTLDLTVDDALKEFPAANRVISKCQNIGSHFSRSVKSKEALTNMQKAMNMPELKLKTQCETRWNSTFYMLERIIDIKRPLNAVISNLSAVNGLNQYEWSIIDSYVNSLRPLEQATKIMSATRYCTISMVIPVVRSFAVHYGTATELILMRVVLGAEMVEGHRNWMNIGRFILVHRDSYPRRDPYSYFLSTHGTSYSYRNVSAANQLQRH